jgi:hypothetical protein
LEEQGVYWRIILELILKNSVRRCEMDSSGSE